jgi:hypothetical protein
MTPEIQEEIMPEQEPIINEAEQPAIQNVEQPIIEEEQQPVIEEEPQPVIEEQNPIVEEEPIIQETNTNTISIPVSRENLDKSAVAVNANVLANLVLYQSILEKIKETSDDKADMESKIAIIQILIQTSKELLQLIQISLNIPEDQQLDEDTIISKSKGDIDSKFKMFNVAESLGFLGLGLALLGGKKCSKSKAKTRRNKGSKRGKKSRK